MSVVSRLMCDKKTPPERYKKVVAEMLKEGVFSESREGNYSIRCNGQDLNYRLEGKELYLTKVTNAREIITSISRGNASIERTFSVWHADKEKEYVPPKKKKS